MKKLYFLDEEEKNRILNLHESLSKKQYLSEATEKGGAGYVDPATDTPEAKIARAFYQSAAGPGTNEANMLTAIQSIKSAVQFWKVNELVKNLPGNSGKLDIAGVINDEMGRDNLEDIKKIIASLKTAGITATNGIDTRKTNSGITTEYFKENTFKITSQPVVQPLVTKQPDVNPKVTKRPAVDYKKINQQKLAARLKQTQKSLGISDSGGLDNATLQAIITKLSSRPQVSSVKSEIQTAGIKPLNSSTLTARVNADQLNSL
jgi:hypothetical protein